jgi:isopenicillin N synthase-like dioxygenase
MGSISETPLVEIPIVNISGYLAGDPEAKKKAASEFRSACENQGFLQVVGHSVPPDVQERFLSAIARFFALPLSEKTKVSQEKSKCYRGYERIGGQKLDELDTSATPDQKEGFSVRPERALGRFLQGPNQWPEDLPGFKEAYMEYFNSVHQLSKSVFRLMALSLDLPEDHFDAFAADPDGKLRAPEEYWTFKYTSHVTDTVCF